MTDLNAHADALRARFGDQVEVTLAHGEIELLVGDGQLIEVCTALRDEADFAYQQLIDLCGVDYSQYGQVEWDSQASAHGFSRAVEPVTMGRLSFGDELDCDREGPRYASVMQLLSVRHNRRLRVKCFAPDDALPMLPTVTGIWASANWYEREAFDLFGILYADHPDLRRILTDYGFVGHPFRKDFPLVGHVEMRYDPEQQRVVYEPVSIEPRVLTPRSKREDHRYAVHPTHAVDSGGGED
jgi:NADH-quinone oxidoreductase subunit C